MTHRKSNEHGSPLRWGAKPEDIMKNELKSNRWSPYAGKLGKRKDDLLDSIEGNKIKYTHH